MKRIMILDDESDIVELFVDYFTEFDIEVIGAVTSEDALEKIKENQIDVLLTDINMPKKDGLELILEIKAQCPDVKVFAMTGDFVTKDDVGNVEAADAFGAEYVFKKPITPSEVHKKLIELKA